jgi:hypothetical protein
MDPNPDRARNAVGTLRDELRCGLRRRIAVDARSLAAFRIAIGGTILVDLAARVGSLRRFYTDWGAYPRSVHAATYGDAAGLSLHALSGAAWFQAALFAVAGAFAAAFLVGYRTKLVGFVSLALLVSLHVRAPVVLNGGDRLLRVLLFVGLFSPLGERWSVDALRRGSARKRVASVGTAALLTQPLAVFTANAVEKARGELWYGGDAVSVALSDTTTATGFGVDLLAVPALPTALTYGWVVLLAGSVPLLFATTGRRRALAVAAYLTAFAGMALSLSVGLFPLALSASVLPFLPGAVWEGLADRLPVSRVADRFGSLFPRPASPISRRLPTLAAGREIGPRLAAVGRSLSLVAAVAVLAWILAFSAFDAAGAEPPEPLDAEPLDQQDWGLYAPDPARSYSWYVTVAEFSDGSTIDAVDGGPASFDRPPDAGAYGSVRERSFLQSVGRSGRTDGRLARRHAAWACDRAAAVGDAAVARVTVYRFIQRTPRPARPPSDGYPAPRRTTVVERSC